MKRLIYVGLFIFVLQFGAFAQTKEFNLGVNFARNGDYQNALPHFQNSFDKNLSNKKLAQIHYNIGVCFYQLKQTNSAVTEFQQAVKLEPNYERSFYALGMAQKDLKNWSEAETAFYSSIKISNNAESWFDLGILLFEQKKYEESFSAFQNAEKFGSVANAASHNNLGVIYALKGDLSNAEKEINLSKNLGFTEAENNLEILRKAMISNDKYLIGKLILQEKN